MAAAKRTGENQETAVQVPANELPESDPARLKLVTAALRLVSISVGFGMLSGTVSVITGLQDHSLGVFAIGLGVLADVTGWRSPPPAAPGSSPRHSRAPPGTASSRHQLVHDRLRKGEARSLPSHRRPALERSRMRRCCHRPSRGWRAQRTSSRSPGHRCACAKLQLPLSRPITDQLRPLQRKAPRGGPRVTCSASLTTWPGRLSRERGWRCATSPPPSRRGERTARRNDGQPEGAACRASPAAGYRGAAGRSLRTSAAIGAQASCP